MAAVADVALERDAAFVCIPFGTRNHFARDLGLDRDDPIGALHAFDIGTEQSIDVGRVDERLFLNNVSLGLYAESVQREGYRDPSHHRPSFGAILERLELGPEDVLLEIGSGGGAFLQQALRSGCRAKAIDHSPEMMRVARELNADAIEEGRLELLQGIANRLPFEDDSCTCAAMMQVFFFLDPEPVLAECRRVVREGGTLAVFTVSEEAKGSPAAPEPMASRGRFYMDEQLVELARGAGFPDATVEHPDLERHAREAGLPEDVVALFTGAREMSQLLVAR